jgi:hypothetical protein
MLVPSGVGSNIAPVEQNSLQHVVNVLIVIVDASGVIEAHRVVVTEPVLGHKLERVPICPINPG